MPTFKGWAIRLGLLMGISTLAPADVHRNKSTEPKAIQLEQHLEGLKAALYLAVYHAQGAALDDVVDVVGDHHLRVVRRLAAMREGA